MAFFTYPPNEATNPLFTQLTVSGDAEGSGLFGTFGTDTAVQNAAYSFCLTKAADIGATAGRPVGIRARLTGNTNATTGGLTALRSETRRSTLSASVSDSVSFNSLSLSKTIIDFTAASIPATYTSSGTHRAISIDNTFGSNLTGNTLAISNIVGIEFTSDSQANTGRKTNILLNALSGGSSGNAQIADNSSYSGNWFINSTSTSSSLFSGTVGVVGSPSISLMQVGGIANQTLLSGTTQEGLRSFVRSNSSATSRTLGLVALYETEATAYTTGVGVGIRIQTPTIGAGSTVTRNVGLLFQGVGTGGTNNAFISDNETFTSNWFLNSTSTNKSSLTGALATVRFDVASAATITSLDSSRSFVKLTGSTITALQGITAGVDGQKLTLVNLTNANLTVANENAGATAANRITTMTGADVVTTGNGAAEFIYDTGSSRWICLYVTA